MRPQLVPTDNRNSAQPSNRRRFLLGIGTATAMLAGCLSGDDNDDLNGTDENGAEENDDTEDGPADEPGYANWLPAENDWLYVAYVNFDVPEAGEQDEISLDPAEDVDDPLVTFPLEVGSSTVGLFSLGLAAADLLPVLDPDEEFESEASSLLVVNGTIVVEGTFDTDELHDRLTREAEPFAATYEQTSALHGYDRYEPVEVPDGLEDAPVVALDEDTMVVGSDADRLEQVAATGAGDRQSAAEADVTVAWLVEQTGDGDVVFGHIGPVPETEFDLADSVGDEPPFHPAESEDVMAAATFDPETDQLDARFALTADDLAEVTRETVENEFGMMGSDVSVDIEDDRLTSSATYDAADISVGTDNERQDLSREEAEALVPEDALEFRYEPPLDDEPFGEFWVEIVEETAAAAIRVEADSGGYNEVGPQEGTVNPGTGVPVQIDPDGDGVTVFAVDETDAIGELTSKQVPTGDLTSEEVAQAVPEDSFSFAYEPPEVGDLGSLHIEVVADTDADVLVAQPREAPGSFSDSAGSLDANEPVAAGTTLQVPVDPDGDDVVVFATVGEATGEVTRWEGP